MYQTLEHSVYAKLRSGQTLEALLEVQNALPKLSGADWFAGSLLLANVQVQCGVRNYAACMGRLRDVLGADVPLLVHLKARLLLAHLAAATRDYPLWRAQMDAYPALAEALPAWTGRFLRSEAHGLESFDDLSAAIAMFTRAAAWHTDNLGPYDEQDRRCYLGACYANLTRLYVQVGDMAGAESALRLAEAIMPAGTYQTWIVPFGRAHLALARDDLVAVPAAIQEAQRLLGTHANCTDAALVADLEATYYRRMGNSEQTRERAAEAVRLTRLSRNLSLLTRLQRTYIRRGDSA